jgi:hypothetical protein
MNWDGGNDPVRTGQAQGKERKLGFDETKSWRERVDEFGSYFFGKLVDFGA